jgi:hypothetical protein
MGTACSIAAGWGSARSGTVRLRNRLAVKERGIVPDVGTG